MQTTIRRRIPDSILPRDLKKFCGDFSGDVPMRDGKDVTVAADIDIYFCDPHAPWQRGSNENTNGLLRQYFPKGSDLSEHDETTLDLVAAELNDRSRKRLGFGKPVEKITDLLLAA